MMPDEVATAFLHDFQKNKPESYIGKTIWLKRILRLSPWLGNRIVKNG